MVACANWVPAGWGAGPEAISLGPSSAMASSREVTHCGMEWVIHRPQCEPDISHERGLTSFDVERFVDRLVDEDSPLAQPLDGAPAHLWDAPKPGSPQPPPLSGVAHGASAKLFIRPYYNWQAPPTVESHGYRPSGGSTPCLVPYDPILDILFTPARNSPEVVPTVTSTLVDEPHAGLDGVRAQVVSCAVPAYHTVGLTVPMAPMRPIRLVSPPFFAGDAIGGLESGNAAFCTTESACERKATLLTGADAHTCEYDDDRHTFLLRQEVTLFVGSDYLTGPGRPGLVTPATRTSLVDWIAEVHAAAPAASGGGPALSTEALLLAINIVDRFLSTADGARAAYDGLRSMHVVGAAALGLASKYEDTQPASLWGLTVAANSTAGVGDGGASVDQGASGEMRAARKEVAATEMRVAMALGFRLTVPTAASFLGIFLRRAAALGYLPAGPAAERVRNEAQQILLRMVRDACFLEHLPSAVAASALYWASCISAPGQVPPTTLAFAAVTGYNLDGLSRCLRDMEAVRLGGRWNVHVAGGAEWAGAAFPEHAGSSFFGAGGGHPAIAAL